MTDAEVAYYAKWIARYGSAEKLLKQHTMDAEDRCPTCRPGGSSSGHVKGPCLLYLAAQAARR